MPWVGFEPTTPVFERAKAFNALDRAAIVIDSDTYNFIKKICSMWILIIYDQVLKYETINQTVLKKFNSGFGGLTSAAKKSKIIWARCFVFLYKYIYSSEERTASIFRIKIQAKQITKLITPYFLLVACLASSPIWRDASD
jgi:hypothetical protein